MRTPPRETTSTARAQQVGPADGPRIRRLRAPNPGPMTGEGTNTYLLGEAEIAVIDPGPAIASHVDAILRAAPGAIRWVLVTHTHLDHSPAARALASRCGALTLGRPAPRHARHDLMFAPDRVLGDGDTLETGELELRAVHTPGHASNHLCYWLPRSGTLFTGDHVIGGSTVVIDPPDGDMALYLESLRKLRALRAERLMPGHGAPIADPSAAIDALLAHRRRRESKVLGALDRSRAAALEALVASVYDDVDASLHGVASRSLLAHLIKLESDGRVRREPSGWRLR